MAQLRKAIQRLRRPASSSPLPADTVARVEQCRTTWTGYSLEQMEQLIALLSTGLRPARAA